MGLRENNKLTTKFKPYNEYLSNNMPDLFAFDFEIGKNFLYYFPQNNITKVLENFKIDQSEKKKKHNKLSKSPRHNEKMFPMRKEIFPMINSEIIKFQKII